eukprot:TRINITY_DN1507_c0_g2_i4.p1 TRINITY_DN1507_c0_g2~~TRINITY_DN1507_c0_g2_i4.p1  ORF type:complete len:279 (+),score=76.66 TRINITY_DN1507_c0_g2_i4:370-1206(+)
MTCRMSYVSNGDFTTEEFMEWLTEMQRTGQPIPTEEDVTLKVECLKAFNKAAAKGSPEEYLFTAEASEAIDFLHTHTKEVDHLRFRRASHVLHQATGRWESEDSHEKPRGKRGKWAKKRRIDAGKETAVEVSPSKPVLKLEAVEKYLVPWAWVASWRKLADPFTTSPDCSTAPLLCDHNLLRYNPWRWSTRSPYLRSQKEPEVPFCLVDKPLWDVLVDSYNAGPPVKLTFNGDEVVIDPPYCPNCATAFSDISTNGPRRRPPSAAGPHCLPGPSLTRQ